MEHPENSEEYKGLTVNNGVGPVSIVNPYLKRGRFARRKLSAADYVEGILKGNVKRNACPTAARACASASAEFQVQARVPVSTSLASMC